MLRMKASSSERTLSAQACTFALQDSAKPVAGLAAKTGGMARERLRPKAKPLQAGFCREDEAHIPVRINFGGNFAEESPSRWCTRKWCYIKGGSICGNLPIGRYAAALKYLDDKFGHTLSFQYMDPGCDMDPANLVEVKDDEGLQEMRDSYYRFALKEARTLAETVRIEAFVVFKTTNSEQDLQDLSQQHVEDENAVPFANKCKLFRSSGSHAQSGSTWSGPRGRNVWGDDKEQTHGTPRGILSFAEFPSDAERHSSTVTTVLMPTSYTPDLSCTIDHINDVADTDHIHDDKCGDVEPPLRAPTWTSMDGGDDDGDDDDDDSELMIKTGGKGRGGGCQPGANRDMGPHCMTRDVPETDTTALAFAFAMEVSFMQALRAFCKSVAENVCHDSDGNGGDGGEPLRVRQAPSPPVDEATGHGERTSSSSSQKEHLRLAAAHDEVLNGVAKKLQSEVFVLAKMGEGAFGEVSRAFVLPYGVVAVKSLKASRTAAYLEFFKHEAATLAKLRHPNIIQMFGVVVDAPEGGGNPIIPSGAVTPTGIVMEFMRNGSLHDYLRSHYGRQMTLRQRAMIALQVCLGMAYVHQQSLVHFDLKPDNLLIDGEGDNIVVKIADFGVALSNLAGSPTICTMRGTLPYMAPEVVSGSRPASEKVDVYSMGVILWQLYTNEEPFSGMAAEVVVEGITRGSLQLVLPVACEAEWRLLVEACMDNNPENRPSFQDLVVLLQKILCMEELNAANAGCNGITPMGDAIAATATEMQPQLNALGMELYPLPEIPLAAPAAVPTHAWEELAIPQLPLLASQVLLAQKQAQLRLLCQLQLAQQLQQLQQLPPWLPPATLGARCSGVMVEWRAAAELEGSSGVDVAIGVAEAVLDSSAGAKVAVVEAAVAAAEAVMDTSFGASELLAAMAAAALDSHDDAEVARSPHLDQATLPRMLVTPMPPAPAQLPAVAAAAQHPKHQYIWLPSPPPHQQQLAWSPTLPQSPQSNSSAVAAASAAMVFDSSFDADVVAAAATAAAMVLDSSMAAIPVPPAYLAASPLPAPPPLLPAQHDWYGIFGGMGGAGWPLVNDCWAYRAT